MNHLRIEVYLNKYFGPGNKLKTFRTEKRRRLKEAFSIEDHQDIAVRKDEDIIRNIETKEKLSKVEKYLNKLPPKQREVFILKNYEQMTYEEISEITGKSIGGLKSNYFQAMKKLMEMVKNDE